MDYSSLSYDQVRNSQTRLREWIADHICDYHLLYRGDDFAPALPGHARNGVAVPYGTAAYNDSRLMHKIVDIPRNLLMRKDFTMIDLGISVDEDWNGYFHFGKIEHPYKEFTDAGMQVGDFIMTNEVNTETMQVKMARIKVTQELFDLYNGIRLTYAITTHFNEE